MEEVTETILDLSHLTLQAQALAILPGAERINRIRSERWIGYTYAGQALMELENLFAWPSRQRMPNMLIIGPTNNGKSMIIEKFRRQHLPRMSSDGSKEIVPVVIMEMPSEPSITRFYTMLLHAMNTPTASRLRIPDLEVLALRIMKTIEIRMLIIDELHNMLSGGPSVRREFLNLIRFLGNMLRIPIIGVGTEDAYRAIRTDDQLENRFKPFILPRWKEDDELMLLLASFASSFPLRSTSYELHSREMARYILARTEGTIGEIAMLLMGAAIIAIESGEEAINSKTLARVDYDSPTQRRQKFERGIV
ncbi:MAG: TniB family NTP-binding protein [Candidatus Parvarchaeum sp.]|jgi:hypothetical protein